MDKRKLKLEEYGISEKRYKELCGFCEQYPEWKQILSFGSGILKSVKITGMPKSNRISDKTADIAVRRTSIAEKCRLVESTAEQASKELAPYIIKSVCYGVTFNYLIMVDDMPSSRSAFYDARRYFFYLLDSKKG